MDQHAPAISPTEQTATRRGRARLRWLVRLLRWNWILLRSLLQLLMIAWASLAIYYSNLPWPSVRLGMAITFAALSIWALWLTRRPRMRLAFAAAFFGVFMWFASIQPTHDRPWRAEVAVMPRAAIDGDHVRITGVRNFDYRSRYDFTPRYEQRELSIAHATSLDFFISYWHAGPVAHTFVSFNFDDGTPPLCISIECRPAISQGFAPLASIFKQFELIYIVGDERDIVGSRASYRGEQVYLYPIRAPSEAVQRLLRIYLDRINQLADHAEFYHLLKSNCTINIVRYANRAGRHGRYDIRHLLNGWVDEYLYEDGWVDTSLPFEQLRRRSRITDVAKAAQDSADFSRRIRDMNLRSEDVAH